MLSCCAVTARAESRHTLRSAEAAFYHAGLPFQGEWTPDPYLRPTPTPAWVPKRLLADVTGWAAGANAVTFKVWDVTVFDQSAPALAFSSMMAARARSSLVLRADNVVYVGARLPAAERAMAQLRRGH
jgi:hypothetical protein